MKGHKGHAGEFAFYLEGHQNIQRTQCERDGETWFLHKRGRSGNGLGEWTALDGD